MKFKEKNELPGEDFDRKWAFCGDFMKKISNTQTPCAA